jgi:hypothetical protein
MVGCALTGELLAEAPIEVTHHQHQRQGLAGTTGSELKLREADSFR